MQAEESNAKERQERRQEQGATKLGKGRAQRDGVAVDQDGQEPDHDRDPGALGRDRGAGDHEIAGGAEEITFRYRRSSGACT